MERKKHELKTWPVFWQAVFDNIKNFEVRKNDRDFRIGDEIILREWNPVTEKYTGRVTSRIIAYTLHDLEYVKEGMVILSWETCRNE